MNLATTLTPSKPNEESHLRNDQSWITKCRPHRAQLRSTTFLSKIFVPREYRDVPRDQPSAEQTQGLSNSDPRCTCSSRGLARLIFPPPRKDGPGSCLVPLDRMSGPTRSSTYELECSETWSSE